MAAGFPAKANYATGDILTATNMNDLAGTLNLVTTSTLSGSAGKNAVINGGFEVWQRGTSFTSNGYTADRWYGLTPTNITISRQLTNDTTNLPNIQYCVRLARSAGSTAAVYPQVTNSFETINSIPFAGKAVTLSFYARAGANFSASGGQISAYVPTGTGTDQNVKDGYTGETSPVGGVATLTTTWQRFTFTGTIPTNATEMGVKIFALTAGTAGAADYFEVTGVQVELGSTATSFSRNGGTYQGELAACQRYYWRTSATGLYSPMGQGSANGTSGSYITIQNPVQMRAINSVEYANLGLQEGGDALKAVTSVTIDQSDLAVVSLSVGASGGGLTQYRANRLLANNNSSAYLAISGEL